MIREDLAAHLGRPITRVEPISTGHSGFTYFVDLGDVSRYVLRLPPPGARIAGPADVVRQGRIMSALHTSGLPVPSIAAMSDQPVIDGRPFILMQAVDGARIDETRRREAPREIARSAVAVMKRLHAVS